MYSKSVFLTISLIVLAQLEAFADSATQSDWSGGGGIWGPVIDWGNQFSYSVLIDYSTSDSLQLNETTLEPIEHNIDESCDGACSIHASDLDGDDDIDILGAAQYGDCIFWWENSDTSPGIYWTKHIVANDFDGAASVYSEDINGDGYMDIIGAANQANDIIWWENDGSGTSWTAHTVEYNYRADYVCSADINDDGYMDIIGSGCFESDIIWWENDDGSGTSWTEHIVPEPLAYHSSVCTADVDGDGYEDIISTSYDGGYDYYVIWLENTDGSGLSWTEHIINDVFEEPDRVSSADIDNDGDIDVLVAYSIDWRICWFENVDGCGSSWTLHHVWMDEGFFSAYPSDVDGDGDVDILGAVFDLGKIIWWENLDGTGTSLHYHLITNHFSGAAYVYAADVDDDGIDDVLGAALFADEVTWWKIGVVGFENGWLRSSILDIQETPDWQTIDWNCDEPVGTSVAFQVRASDSPYNMGLWSDTLTSPGTLTGIIADGDSLFQYRALLNTSDPDSTPILHNVTITWDLLGIHEDPPPLTIELFPLNPNPMKTAPVARFALPEPGVVRISIFDVSGRLLIDKPPEEYYGGYHSINLDNISPGIYFCRMISGDFTATQRFVVID